MCRLREDGEGFIREGDVPGFSDRLVVGCALLSVFAQGFLSVATCGYVWAHCERGSSTSLI